MRNHLEQQQANHIVAATDLSELGDRSVVEAMRQCHVSAGAQLHVVTVGLAAGEELFLPDREETYLSLEKINEFMREHIEKLVKDYESRYGEPTLQKIATYVAMGNPAERIVALARHVDAELIVMGTHGRRGFDRWLFGSVAQEVLRRANCGVLVIRPRDFLAGEKLPDIAAPLQEGEHALKPFRHAPTYHQIERGSKYTSRVLPVA